MRLRRFTILFLVGVLIGFGLWGYQNRILDAGEDQSIGNSKLDTAKLQIGLRERGFSVPVTGIYGPETQAAVNDFVAEENLLVDGIVGPQTWNALMNTGLDELVENLPVGEVYHNVPDQMRVGEEETIEAGIAPQITDQIRAAIQGEGEVVIQSGITFNPAGFEMKLITNDDEFKVLKAQEGRRYITYEQPGQWVWEIRPLKSGKHEILIYLETDRPPSPALSQVTSQPPAPIIIQFSNNVEVRGNFLYSTQEFIKKDGIGLFGAVLGSGLAVPASVWLIAKTRRLIISFLIRGWATLFNFLTRFY